MKIKCPACKFNWPKDVSEGIYRFRCPSCHCLIESQAKSVIVIEKGDAANLYKLNGDKNE